MSKLYHDELGLGVWIILHIRIPDLKLETDCHLACIACIPNKETFCCHPKT